MTSPLSASTSAIPATSKRSPPLWGAGGAFRALAGGAGEGSPSARRPRRAASAAPSAASAPLPISDGASVSAPSVPRTNSHAV
ncbi:MAG: hypothetical protein M5U29_00105 [Anaerolineae bacterium]|nr:hypothetical protein [Anaerolineae bacterium]